MRMVLDRRESVLRSGVKMVTWTKQGIRRSDGDSVGVGQDHDGPRTVLVMLPGNPGIAEYYLPWVEDLARTNWVQSQVDDIVVVNYGGFTTATPSVMDPSGKTRSWLTIHEECELIHDVLLEQMWVDLDRGDKVVLVGHSIGCYLGLEMLRNTLVGSAVVASLFLFPFMVLDHQGAEQAKIGRLVRWSLIVGMVRIVTWILMRVPKWSSLVEPMLRSRFRGTMTDHAVDVTARYFGRIPHLGQSVVRMAATEFESLPASPDAFVQRYGPVMRHRIESTVFAYTEADRWGPLWQADWLESQFPGMKVLRFCSGKVPHAFCTQQEAMQMVCEELDRKMPAIPGREGDKLQQSKPLDG